MTNLTRQTARTSSGLTLEFARQGPVREIPLVCLHGFTDSCRSYGPLFEALPRDAHAIAVSLRGHGGSDRPEGPYTIAAMAGDISDLLDELGIERALVVGHCMGGFVAQRFAVNCPGRAAGLDLAPRAQRDQPGGSDRRAATYRRSGATDLGRRG